MLLRLCLLALLSAASLSAADIYVTTTAMTIDVPGAAFISADSSGRSGLYDPGTLSISDLPGSDGLISLPEAIIAANNTVGADTIHLGAHAYTVLAPHNYWYGPNGLPPIASGITIEGNGAVIERDTSAAPFRLFYVMGPFHTGAGGKWTVPAGTLTLRRCTLRNGLARGGDGAEGREVSAGTTVLGGGGGGLGAGGAIFSQGTLTLDSCTFHDNTARGGGGRGIVTGTASTAGAGGGIGGDAGNGGGGFFGTGFVLNESSSNGGLSIFGGHGAAAQASSADGGGGGFSASDNANSNSGINGGGSAGASNVNAAGGAFGGGGDLSSGGGIGGGGGGSSGAINGGAGGFGGGGGGGFGGDGGLGGFGAGGGAGGILGGVPSSGGNGGWGAGGGGNAVSGGAGGGGGAGMGGALFSHAGSVILINCTFSENRAQGGDSTGGESGGGLGGALFNLNGSVLVVSSTIAANVRLPGASALQVTNQSAGGAIYSLLLNGAGVQTGATSATVTLENSILADSLDGGGGAVSDFGGGGTAASDSHSIVESGWFGTGGPRAVDPQLGALSDNDGPGVTMKPAAGSVGVNSGNNSATYLPGSDQRGVARISSFTVDVGAVEIRSNNAPQISSPAPVQTGFGQSYVFNGGVFSISDDGAFGESLELSLYSPHGVYTLPQISGLSFGTGDGTADTTIVCTGTLDSINAALDGLIFIPSSGFTGQGILSIGIDDLGHTGVGGAKQNSAYAYVDVTAPDGEITVYHAGFNTPDGGGEIIPLTVGKANAFIYTVSNGGTGNLLISGLSIYNRVNCNVTITAQPPDTISSGGTGHFIIEVTPLSKGQYRFEWALQNSDADESPFDILVIGEASSPQYTGRRAVENCSTGESNGYWWLTLLLPALLIRRTRHAK